jgi:signal transduction histidine kinase
LIEKYLNSFEPEKSLKHIERIKASVENLSNILDVFLSVEKLEQGKVKLEPEQFDFAAFMQKVTGELESILKPGQHIIYEHKGDTSFLTDKKILQNILLNLLSNAIKYSDKDITVNSRNERNSLSITVADKGIGIPREEQVYLFSKFFRASNANNIQGTGLGLNIVQRYVELLHGNIAVKSKQGEGTTFSLLLPHTPHAPHAR